jgi:hypothetical protein
MTRPPDFSHKTVRLLAERAGQRCSNPQCGSPTSGPSDDGSGDSTTLGRACHISGARPSGPRYDPSLTDPQRAHANNGIWLCAVCADRVDKRENEAEFPVELLRVWKQFHESATGTDHASVENRRRYPLRQLCQSILTPMTSARFWWSRGGLEPGNSHIANGIASNVPKRKKNSISSH